MCFSATASFVASAGLFSASVYMVKVVKRLNFRAVVSVVMPLGFSVQQAAEGCVWLALNNGHQQLANNFGLLYMFFGFFFWPAYMPLLGLVNESDHKRKRAFAVIMVAGLIYGLNLYLPLISQHTLVQTAIVNQCIAYSMQFNILATFSYIPNGFIAVPGSIHNILYLFFGSFSMLISSHRSLGILGVMIGIAYTISYTFYTVISGSIWCYFAAIISIMMIVIEKNLFYGAIMKKYDIR